MGQSLLTMFLGKVFVAVSSSWGGSKMVVEGGYNCASALFFSTHDQHECSGLRTCYLIEDGIGQAFQGEATEAESYTNSSFKWEAVSMASKNISDSLLWRSRGMIIRQTHHRNKKSTPGTKKRSSSWCENVGCQLGVNSASRKTILPRNCNNQISSESPMDRYKFTSRLLHETDVEWFVGDKFMTVGFWVSSHWYCSVLTWNPVDYSECIIY